jgi:DNA polymerase V
MKRIIALSDVNNCFASSEVVFQPELAGKPLVILSNNDGCAIARSAEAKAMGIKMAQPYFQFKHLEKQGLMIRSANFSLYTNLSERIRSVLETLCPDVVPYSIDESFLDLTGFKLDELESYGRYIKQTVFRCTHMPVGVGIADSMTLAKAANWAAKKYTATGGVVSIAGDKAKRERLLKVMPVSEVWGCGKQTAQKLSQHGIITAYDLAQLNQLEMRDRYGVVLTRTIKELNGEEALEWAPDHSQSKQIIASRSLGEKTDNPEILFAAISAHVSRASKKLRAQNAVAHAITVYLHSSEFSDYKKAHLSETIKLVEPSSDNRILLNIASRAFDKVYQSGYRYAKTGVTLSNIISNSDIQTDLFSEQHDEKNTELMNALDSLNGRYGLGTIKMGAEVTNNLWRSNSEWKSQNFTGSWDELPTAYCE